MQSASNDAGTYTFAYDTSGRLVHETEPFDQSLSFSYDDKGNVASVTDSAGGVTASKYDNSGELVSRQLSVAGGETIGVAFTYDGNRQVESLTRSDDGATVGSTSYAYNPDGQVTSIIHVDSSSRLIDGFSYKYDTAGRLASETELTPPTSGPGGPTSSPNGPAGPFSAPATGAAATSVSDPTQLTFSTDGTGSSDAGSTTTNYAYDASGQLIADGARKFSYDPNGNRLGAGVVNGPDNQVLADGTWTYRYDAEGNRIGKASAAAGISWSYTYDDANRLTSATETDAHQSVLYRVTYAYDVFGNRIEQDTWSAGAFSPAVERYSYNGQQAWADLDADNQVTTR